MTINEMMSLMKQVNKRINDLSTIRQSVANTEHRFFGNDERKEVIPEYDVKKVDTKITELQNFLFKADSAIKQSNASTQITIEVDVDSLLAPLE